MALDRPRDRVRRGNDWAVPRGGRLGYAGRVRADVRGALASARTDVEGLAGRKRGKSIDDQVIPPRYLCASRLGRRRSVGLTDHPKSSPRVAHSPKVIPWG